MRRSLGVSVMIACMVGLTACSLPRDGAMQSQAEQMTPCERIDRLVAAYADGFEQFKGPQISQRFLDIWAAKVDAIGRGCQIWKAGAHTTYMCVRNAPDEAVAREWFDKANGQMQQCLGDWQQQDASAIKQDSEALAWTRAGNFPAIGLQLVQVRGGQWAVYYFIGDRDKWF